MIVNDPSLSFRNLGLESARFYPYLRITYVKFLKRLLLSEQYEFQLDKLMVPKYILANLHSYSRKINFKGMFGS